MRSMKRFMFMCVAVIMLIPAICFPFGVDLGWDESTSPNISYYTIYYGMEPGEYTESVFSQTPTMGSVEDLEDGTMYYFAVNCTDIFGNTSGFSNEVFTNGDTGETPDPPGACIIRTIKP